jgi:hypothetical protein
MKSWNLRKLWTTLPLLLSASIVLAANPEHLFSQDPLFSQMEGSWTGQGVRTEAISGRQIQIRAVVATHYETDGGVIELVSQNQITETSPGSAPNSYESTYWVRVKVGEAGTYELGAPGQSAPSSIGILGQDGIFRVEQDLGGASGVSNQAGSQAAKAGLYVIRSETEFQSNQTVYSDRFTDGSELQSQTRIVYQRTAGSF